MGGSCNMQESVLLGLNSKNVLRMKNTEGHILRHPCLLKIWRVWKVKNFEKFEKCFFEKVFSCVLFLKSSACYVWCSISFEIRDSSCEGKKWTKIFRDQNCVAEAAARESDAIPGEDTQRADWLEEDRRSGGSGTGGECSEGWRWWCLVDSATGIKPLVNRP